MRHSSWLRALLALLMALAVSSQLAAKVYLVSVGITDYPGTSNDLNNTVRDAQSIAWVYSKRGDTESHLLLNGQATRQNILSKMRDAYGKAGKDDLVVFFFSGHGYQGGFVCSSGQRLSYDDVRQVMSSSQSHNRIIFADACYAGTMGRTSRASQSVVEAAKKANVMLFLSSRYNETSIESLGMKNGFFTNYLQKGLRGAADSNKDRIVTARELYEYVHSNVITLSKNRQHPVMWGHFDNAMPVIVWK